MKKSFVFFFVFLFCVSLVSAGIFDNIFDRTASLKTSNVKVGVDLEAPRDLILESILDRLVAIEERLDALEVKFEDVEMFEELPEGLGVPEVGITEDTESVEDIPFASEEGSGEFASEEGSGQLYEAVCGDFVCDESESILKCPEDCLEGYSLIRCGDGVCDASFENERNCREDCGVQTDYIRQKIKDWIKGI